MGGLVGIKAAKSEYGDSRCFYMIRENGTEEDVSMKKCVDAVEANPPYVKIEKKEEEKKEVKKEVKKEEKKEEKKVEEKKEEAKVEPKKEEAKVEEKKEEAKTELKKDGTDFKLITSLLEFHPKGAEKRKGLVGIKVAKSEYGDSRCFYMVRDDGSSEDVSMKKCVD